MADLLGLLLTIVDFGINRVDILPDFIGYFLIAVGCAGLDAASRRFSAACACSVFLALMSLAEYFVPRDPAMILKYFSFILDPAMMWVLLGGVMELARSRERHDLGQIASTRRIVYIVYTAFVFMFAWVSSTREPSVSMVSAFWLARIFLVGLILHVVYRAKRELSGDGAMPRIEAADRVIGA